MGRGKKIGRVRLAEKESGLWPGIKSLGGPSNLDKLARLTVIWICETSAATL